MSHSTVTRIQTPLQEADVRKLNTGDSVLLSGLLYTARDSAHQRMIEILEDGRPLPIDLKDQVLFYAGPAPAPPGKPVGSIGPTTACRMDAYTPRLLQQGLKGMIGKGARNRSVRDAMKTHGAVYFAALGGVAALLAGCVRRSRIVAFDDLGPEAVRQLEVADFPVIVVNDVHGRDLYEAALREAREDQSRQKTDTASTENI